MVGSFRRVKSKSLLVYLIPVYRLGCDTVFLFGGGEGCSVLRMVWRNPLCVDRSDASHHVNKKVGIEPGPPCCKASTGPARLGFSGR